VLVGPESGGIAPVVSAAARELEARGWTVVRPHMPVRRTPAIDGAAAVIQVWKDVRGAAVVHVEFGRLDLRCFWFAVWASLLRPDIVVVAHDAPRPVLAPSTGLLGTGTRWRSRLGYRVLSPVLDGSVLALLQRRLGVGVTFSQRAAQAWSSQSGVRTVAVELGSDPPHAHRLRPSEGEFVLFAGYLDPRKGVDVLLEAWRAASSHTALPLVIVGAQSDDNPEVSHYVERLRELGAALDRPPRWLGALPDDEFCGMFTRAALLVAPYRRGNPSSGILVRAMVEGRPVLSTAIAPARDLVRNGEDGVLIPPDDVPALTEALRSLLVDGELRDRLGRSAEVHAAARFSWRRQVDGLERAYAMAAST
jgi:glycosyltransferase involved in cell wall biosynthesis